MLRHIMVLMIVLFMVMVNINEILAQTPQSPATPADISLDWVSFSPEGQYLALVTHTFTDTVVYGQVVLYQISSGYSQKAIFEEYDKGITRASFSPDSTLLAYGYNRMKYEGNKLVLSQHGIKVWRIKDKKCLLDIPEQDLIAFTAFSPRDRVLAYGVDEKIILLDTETQQRTILEGHTSTILSGLVFAPNSKLLASGSASEVKIWDIEQKKVIATFNTPGLSLSFSSDGKILAVTDWIIDEKTTLWDVNKASLAGDLEEDKRVKKVVFSPKKNNILVLVVGIGEESAIRVWDIEKKSNIAGFPIFDGLEVIFSPNGESLVYFSDNAVMCWKIGGNAHSVVIKADEVSRPQMRTVAPQDKLATTWGKIKAN